MSKFILVALFCVSLAAHAEKSLYVVEPMICKGQYNKRPQGWADSYAKTVMKVVSYRSVRAQDCSLANSSSTQVYFAKMEEEVKYDPSLTIGGWHNRPLYVEGNKVSAPHGIWGNELKLTITDSRRVRGKRIDTLSARENLHGGSYYDLTCEATVVPVPQHTENNTANCETPKRH